MQKVLLLIHQSNHEEQLENKTNTIYRLLMEATADTWREKARVHGIVCGLNAGKKIRAGCKKAVCCWQKSDQNVFGQPNQLIALHVASSENAAQPWWWCLGSQTPAWLQRGEFLESVSLSVCSWWPPHGRPFSSQLPDTYGGISGKEVRCCLQHAAIFAYKSASNHFKT